MKMEESRERGIRTVMVGGSEGRMIGVASSIAMMAQAVHIQIATTSGELDKVVLSNSQILPLFEIDRLEVGKKVLK